MVETIAHSGENGVMKAQGRKKGGGEERKRKSKTKTKIQKQKQKEKEKEKGIHKRRRKKRGYKKMEWWKRCRDFTKQFFGRKEEDRQEKEERKMRERT